jgi:hypothetical protein
MDNKTKLKNELNEKGVEAYTSSGLVVKYLALKDVKTFDMSQVNRGGITFLYLCQNNAGAFEVHDGNGRFVTIFPVYS